MTDKPDPEVERFAPGNTSPDGSYLVGKNKPPESGKFRANDGRLRGRRRKGTKNLATDFEEEMVSRVTVSVGGQQKRVTRQRSIVMRVLDNASRGQNSAINMVFSWNAKFGAGTESDAQADQAREELASEAFPNFSDLTADELEEFGRLMAKAAGQPYEAPPKFDHPLAYYSDPTDERNYHHERTVEGISYRRCHIASVGDELIGIENRAYFSAATPRRPGCYRG
ncbi:MAG: DUF5681 domain-containing protein [Nitrobacter sp.]